MVEISNRMNTWTHTDHIADFKKFVNQTRQDYYVGGEIQVATGQLVFILSFFGVSSLFSK